MSKTVMIVDDSRVSRMLLIAMITKAHSDWKIIEAADGTEALEKCNDSIDYFSVDLNMPGIDGIELIEKLKPQFSSSKFALMTANVQDAVRQRCENLDVCFVNKPITEESVGTMLDYFHG